MNPPPEIAQALGSALGEAELYRGATSPNPPVGAAALDSEGRLLGVAAHQRAGTAHAEARLLQKLREEGTLSRARTLVVTLEPCNHHGRTPPCTEAILGTGIREVWVAAPDPNPRVQGGGFEKLRHSGLAVHWIPESRRATELIGPFSKVARTGLPYVTVKTALRRDANGWTQIPLAGQKTFTRPKSILLAHELRKRADAILTGSGTVLADDPSFTVRALPDHPGKSRELLLFDRRGRVPSTWLDEARLRGFLPQIATEPLEAELRRLAQAGALEVLVEAGPELTQTVLDSGFWDEHVVIRSLERGDEVEYVFRNR